MVARVLLVLLLTLSSGCGCGRRPEEQESAEKLRAAIAAETGDTNTLLMFDNGNIRIRSGGQSFTVNQTERRTRPAEIPDDILLPADARYDLWTEGPRGSTLSLLTDLPPEALAAFLREQWTAQAWTEVSDVQADTVRRLAFRKEMRQVAITLEPDPGNAPATRALLFIETDSEETNTP